jgi:hypothetical protein
VATAIIVTAPIVIIPILVAGGASATNGPSASPTRPSGVECVNGDLEISDLNVETDASVTVSLASTDCDYQTLTLVSYSTEGPDYNSAGTQTLFDKDTRYVTSEPQTLAVDLPNCFYQIDLIYGSDTPTTLADQELYFTNHGTLVASFNAGTEECGPGPSGSPSTTGSPSTPDSTPSGSVLPSGDSTPPGTSVSPTDTPTGGSVLPTVTITTTLTDQPSDSPTGTTSVGGIETSQAGNAATPTVSVEGETFTRGNGASVLPFTGMPVAALVLIALEMIGAGTLAVLYVRRRSAGAHR